MSQQDRAAVFRSLHAPGELLRLPNAWDAGSARLFEACGARAIATTSAGLAWSLGYADGNHIPARVLEAAAREISRVTSVPLSVDAEAGLAKDPASVGETVAAVPAAGAVGVNLEDATDPPDLLCAKIEAAKRAGELLGIALFMNARTDVYLENLASKEHAQAETIARGHRAWLGAARDDPCGRCRSRSATQPDARAGLAEPARALGVRRSSAGSSIAEAAYSLARREAMQLLGDENAGGLPALTYPELNALFR